MVYVILEGLLVTMFPDNKFQEVFRKLHSRSPRVKGESRESSPSIEHMLPGGAHKRKR